MRIAGARRGLNANAQAHAQQFMCSSSRAMLSVVQEPTFAKRLSTKVLGAGNQSALARYNNDIRAHFRPFDDAEKARAIKKVKKCSGEWSWLTSCLRCCAAVSGAYAIVRALETCALAQTR